MTLLFLTPFIYFINKNELQKCTCMYYFQTTTSIYNLLTLNTSKTHYITFALKANAPSLQTKLSCQLIAHSCIEPGRGASFCEPLTETDTVEYLGVTIDQ